VIPEQQGLLAQGVAMLRAAGVDVIAGSGDFLRVASDKWLTAKTLHDASIAHPPFITRSDRRFGDSLRHYSEFVLKPRDGCDSRDIQVFDSLAAAEQMLDEDSILQARVSGLPISISLVASSSTQTYLPAVRQELKPGTFSYQGGCGPLDGELQRRATSLASRAVAAMPPTVRGFVGLDLVLGDEPHRDCVIEINPRLSTSYVGLRKMISGNVAARLFDLETGPVMCSAAVDAVRWTADGRVWIDDLAVDPA
jgi:predicted ATP-grasp superfamily ATP-dependent carboligase